MSRGRRAYDNSSPNTLLVTRSDAIPVLNEIVVAPVTSMIRHIPTCLPVGAAEGINHDSVIVFDQLRCIPKSAMAERLGAWSHERRHEICTALASLSIVEVCGRAAGGAATLARRRRRTPCGSSR
ncbi:type II toxin-antitoxin system PemK/MazF family toxin [Candidatus Neomicrothrix sp.]|uniref:type II toxin-antitoxin system PemK/MazF family toxin n=1 Tax=Candidatus Neomicrothrix sp. TaxID=2719034 RepID=UPI003CD0D39E